MTIKWEKWDSERASPKDLLNFRNRVLGIRGKPSQEELHALKIHMVELASDKSLYNLVAYKDENLVAWMNGKFSETRLTDIIRSLFFDHKLLSKQDIDNLLYQIEFSLPFPFRRIEIYGLGPGREETIRVVEESGYRKDFEVGYFQREIGSWRPLTDKILELDFDHTIYPHTAYDIYRNAFGETWDRDMIIQDELLPIVQGIDRQFSFLAFHGESPAGMIFTNKGLSADEVYLQIIAVQPRMKNKRIGDAMMSYLEDLLASHGIGKIFLSTYMDNKSMMKFIERWNFKLIYKEPVLCKEEIVRTAE